MNDRLFVWKDKKTRTGTFAGVVLEVLKDEWIHVGFLYRTETSSGTFVLHLRGHNLLLHDPPSKGQVCVLPRIEPVRIPALAAFARNIYRKNKHHGIPYSFSSPEHEWFSPQGQLLLGPDQLGLTCGNFVLAIYRAAGLPLVQLNTWPTRPEDKVWQASVISQWKVKVKNDKKKQAHLARMRKEIGAVRCRPAEIAGAALAEEIPCSFPEASANSGIIAALLI